MFCSISEVEMALKRELKIEKDFSLQKGKNYLEICHEGKKKRLYLSDDGKIHRTEYILPKDIPEIDILMFRIAVVKIINRVTAKLLNSSFG